MAKVGEESVATYLRIAKSAADTLHGTASLLGLPVSRVVNALFHFMLAPTSFQDNWEKRVRELRQAINEHTSENGAVRIYDFSAREWDFEKHETYRWLECSGLVEDLAWRRSSERRILCSFKVSDAGRVVAEVFKNAGMTDDVDDADMNMLTSEGSHELIG
jgi:hypothetical protein